MKYNEMARTLSEVMRTYSTNYHMITPSVLSVWADRVQQLETSLASAAHSRDYNARVIDQRNAEIGRLQQELKQAAKEMHTAAEDRRALQANIDQLVENARVTRIERTNDMQRINAALSLTTPLSVDEICAAAYKYRACATNSITVQHMPETITLGGAARGCGGAGLQQHNDRDTMKRALCKALENGSWLSSELLVDAVLMELFPQPGKRLEDIPVPQATRPAAALSFEEVTEPVIEWLNAHHNPHTECHIEVDGAWLMSTETYHPTAKFIKD